MDTVINILTSILPACITGVVTFLVTKYNYHRNVPLDKLEITYNRLYYPIYRLLRDNKETMDVMEQSDKYIKKYGKYIDRSTLKAFEFLKANPQDKKAHENYRNNIYAINSRLRRRLGYLEPSVLNMYTYSSPSDKRAVRIILECMMMYISVIFIAAINLKQSDTVITVIFFAFFVAFICEIIMWIYEWLKKVAKYFFQ